MTRRSKAVSSLSGLSRASPDIADALSANPWALDDRSLAIVTGANVEKSLEDQLMLRMTNVSAAELKVLFQSDGAPLGTFSAKIKIGHAFGVFGSSTKNDLEIIRQIRNAFAHARKPITFATTEVSDACRRLQTPNRFPERMFLKDYNESNMRHQFFGTCGLIQFSFAFRDDPDITDFKHHPLD